MEIKQIVDNFLLEKSYSLNILEIFKTGSSILKKEGSKDFDVIVIVDNLVEEISKVYFREKTTVNEVVYDLIFMDKTTLNKRMNLEYENDYEKSLLLFNYFHAFKEVEFGSSTQEFNMFLNKEAYLKIVKEIYVSSIGKAFDKYRIGKFFVHYYVILKFYEHNNTIITDDMIKDINLLYSRSIEAEDLINQIDIKIRVI